MSRSQRLGLIAVAAIIAIAALVLLNAEDDDSSRPQTQAPPTTTTMTTTPTAPSAPATPTIRIADGKPVGGIADLKATNGERIRFRVTSDAAHEIHFHGYDISKDVTAGGRVTFDQKATIEGIFEVEIEDLGEQIAKVTVNP